MIPKKSIAILLSTAFLIHLTACRRVVCDCADGDYKSLYFLSKIDSSDIITNGSFSLDSLQISPILIDSNKSGSLIRIEPDIGFGYNILIRADKNTVGYAIKLDTLPPDTLLVTVGETASDECCGSLTAFETLILNGAEIPNDYTVCCVKIFK